MVLSRREPAAAPSTMNPATKKAITLLLDCCGNDPSIREPTQHFGPNGAHRSSIEIAVDQRQHIGKVAKLVPNSFPLSSEWHHLSQERSNDFSRESVFGLRLTIRDCARLRRHLAFALPLGRKNLNAPFGLDFRLYSQIARNRRCGENRPIR